MCNQISKSSFKSRRSSQNYDETPLLLYRKGNLPRGLKNKKPTKGSIVNDKNSLRIDPNFVKNPKKLNVETQKSKLATYIKFDSNNDDLNVVDNEYFMYSPDYTPDPIIPKKKISKIKAVVIRNGRIKK